GRPTAPSSERSRRRSSTGSSTRCCGCGCPTTTASWSSSLTCATSRPPRFAAPTATARRRRRRPGWSRSWAPGAAPGMGGRAAMQKYVIRRLLLAVPVLLLSSAIVFSLMRVMPGDALIALMGESGNVGQKELAKLRKDLGLDRPYYEQYGLWLWQM